MADLNRANRAVADVDIRILSTMAPFLYADFANTTTTGLTGDAVYAMKKGIRAIAFQNPVEGTMTMEMQVYPFRLLALLADGVVHADAVIAKKETIECETAGKLTITGATSGTVFVYAEGEYGGTAIEGTYADNTFTATTAGDLVVGTSYDVGYLISKTSDVQRVSFTATQDSPDLFITMNTLDKDEDGNLTPFIMTAYKASISRDFEFSFSSEGDPASLTLTFNLLADKENRVLDLVEDTSEA